MKMESIGRLAGGVAHDFNNKLQVVLGYTDFMLNDPGPMNTDQVKMLLEIRKAAQQSADLTRQLLGFARKQVVIPKVLDLNENIEGMLNILRRLIGEDIDLVWMPETRLWPVRIDPSQVDQILANLVVNARDAIAGVGKVTIETGKATFDKHYCATHAEAVPGQYVMLAVSDNGCGMEKEVLAHLFEPFFTTKEVGQGTGLGLATVYGIAKQNEGFINVYSEPGKGTTFKIFLPRYLGEVPSTFVEPEETTHKGRGETVLLVEDDEMVLNYGKVLLEHIGYKVISAAHPEEALRLAREHDGEIHLLITDVIMPTMNGRDLADQILTLRPGLKYVFTSGYTANVIAHHGVLDAGVNFIPKPFRLADLAAKVREALGK